VIGRATAPRRGDVYVADLGGQRLGPAQTGEQAGRRPVIVLSDDTWNANRPVITIVPCTTHQNSVTASTTPTDLSEVLLLPPDGGLTHPSLALAGQLRALDKRRLVRRLGALSPQSLLRIEDSVLAVLGL
jgi:mRNA interferase MazF